MRAFTGRKSAVYRIEGCDAKGTRTETSVAVYSAIVLAMKWVEEGLTDVAIFDDLNRQYTIKSLRALCERGTFS